MKARLHAAIATAFLAAPLTANAAYFYELRFDALQDGDVVLAADSISFETPELLTIGKSVTLDPPQDLNGYAVDRVSVCFTSQVSLAFCSGLGFSAPVGGVDGFYMLVAGGFAPGTYATDYAGRGIRTSPYAVNSYYTTGSLTIREVARAVPEPGTLALLALGLLGVAAIRRRSAALPLPATR